MTPGVPDVNGVSSFSVSGSASMSARQAMVRPGRSPRSTPTTPVPAIPVRTSTFAARSRAAMISAVRRSSHDSSGCRWKSRRSAIIDSWRRPISSAHEGFVPLIPASWRAGSAARATVPPPPLPLLSGDRIGHD
jgi:hypothetical protein